MCTIGYNKRLNLVFKNRDKNMSVREVAVINPQIIALKTESANYFSIGINRHSSCAYVSAAVNSPLWTALVYQGKMEEAAVELEKGNKDLANPVEWISKYLPEVANIDEWLEKILNAGCKYRGYNLLLVDKEKAVHVELYGNESHVSYIGEMTAITNHFRHIDYGPKKPEDYPSSYERLNALNKSIKDFVSLEDVFKALKSQEGTKNGSLWRKGNFFTVSSAVVDIDTRALYFTSSPTEEYSRISGNIPPKGSEKIFIEMSRYIDLPTYHKIERGHPFYEEMLEESNRQIVKYYRGHKRAKGKLKTIELGAGTGLYSLELVKHDFIELDCLEIDNECCKMLESRSEAAKYKVILGDAVTYCEPHKYDLVVSTFAHDHIHYDKRFAFAKNIYNNLKKGGRYIMGGEVIPCFSNDIERKKALFLYHNYIIDVALRHDRVQLSELENNALKSGLDMVGDFKRHETMFEKEMESAGFMLIEKKKIGPLDRDDVGGVFVYVFEV